MLQRTIAARPATAQNTTAIGSGALAMQNDLIDTVQWVMAEGIADRRYIAIFGVSYSRYAALAGATFTPDFYCCVMDLC